LHRHVTQRVRPFLIRLKGCGLGFDLVDRSLEDKTPVHVVGPPGVQNVVAWPLQTAGERTRGNGQVLATVAAPDRDADGADLVGFADDRPVLAAREPDRFAVGARQFNPAVPTDHPGTRAQRPYNFRARPEFRHAFHIGGLAVACDERRAPRIVQQVIPLAIARFLEFADHPELLHDPGIVDQEMPVVEAIRLALHDQAGDLRRRHAIAVLDREFQQHRTLVGHPTLTGHVERIRAAEVGAAGMVHLQCGLVGLIHTLHCAATTSQRQHPPDRTDPKQNRHPTPPVVFGGKRNRVAATARRRMESIAGRTCRTIGLRRWSKPRTSPRAPPSGALRQGLRL
jgi:hypothetical protein